MGEAIYLSVGSWWVDLFSSAILDLSSLMWLWLPKWAVGCLSLVAELEHLKWGISCFSLIFEAF